MKDTDPAVVLKKIAIINRHKNIVKDATDLLGSRLIDQGEIHLGVKLISLGWVHDLSKMDNFEMTYLIENEDKVSLKLAIEKHQASNRHHVGFWGNVEEMPRLFIAELVCDLFARSAEFGTNLRDYLKDEFMPLHKINPQGKVYKTIKEFVDLLLEKPFKS